MRIRVIPYAELRRQILPTGQDSLWLDVADGSTVGDVVRQLNVKVEDRLIVGLNGAYAPLDTPLHDNAELTLVTPMEGG
ncbi:MAG: MoaD/ThiS family protein [Chloroflexota bacterium]